MLSEKERNEIKIKLVLQGLTQIDLTNLLGLKHRSTVSGILNGLVSNKEYEKALIEWKNKG